MFYVNDMFVYNILTYLLYT